MLEIQHQMKYLISTDEVIINHVKNHPDKPVHIWVGINSLFEIGIITSVNMETRQLVIQTEKGRKATAEFDRVSIPVYD